MTEASSKAASDEKAEIQRLRRQVTVDQAEIRRLTKLNEQLIERVDLAERVAETQAAASTRSAMMRIQQAQTEFDATLAESHARRKEASAVIERLRDEIKGEKERNAQLVKDLGAMQKKMASFSPATQAKKIGRFFSKG